MAIGTTPLFSKISGSVGPVDYRTRRNGKIEIGKKRIPANPQSTRQLEVRTAYGRLFELWENEVWVNKQQYADIAEPQKIAAWNAWQQVHIPSMNYNPVAYWGGVEGSTNTLHDITKNNNSGNISGATWEQLKSGLWVLSYDGIDDVTTVSPDPIHTFNNSISFSIWTYQEDTNVGAFARKDGDLLTYGFYLFRPSLNKFQIQLLDHNYLNTTTLNSTANYELNKWYMVTAVTNRTTLKMYINGTLNNSTPDWTSDPLGNPVNNLFLGSHPPERAKQKNALPVMLNYDLSDAQIKKLFLSTKHLFGM